MSTVNYYLAAPFTHRDEARQVRELIQTHLGWACTSSWIDNHLSAFDALDPVVASNEAYSDIDDIIAAECMVFLNLAPSEGKMFELGFAVASDMPIYFIGEPTHIFHHLDGLERFNQIEDLINVMGGR